MANQLARFFWLILRSNYQMRVLFVATCIAFLFPTIVFAKPVKIINDKEIFITHLSVVEDQQRTANSCDSTNLSQGFLPVWSFGNLMKQMSGKQNPSDFVLNWLNSWKKNQVVNGDSLQARPLIDDLIIKPWLARSSNVSTNTTKLDLQKSPFRLLSINYRADLRDRSKNKAGEGRFIFGALDANCNVLPFTVIFEYHLPADSCEETLSWASQFHALAKLPFGSKFNSALETITNKFTLAKKDGDLPNGSLLSQLRTNEIALGEIWQLREFKIFPIGHLKLSTVKQTPNLSLNNSSILKDYLSKNSKKILSGKHQVTSALLAGKSDIPFGFVWRVKGVNTDVRHKFALNTCSGCHSSETNTSFLHVSERRQGEVSTLSSFLLGTSVLDPLSFKERSFADLQRRASDMTVLLNTQCSTKIPSVAGPVNQPVVDPSSKFYCDATQQNNPNGTYGKNSKVAQVGIVTTASADIPEFDLSGLEQGCIAENTFHH